MLPISDPLNFNCHQEEVLWKNKGQYPSKAEFIAKQNQDNKQGFFCNDSGQVIQLRKATIYYPYSAIGRIIQKGEFVGTGTLIKKNVILTCKHNLFDKNRKRENLVFSLGEGAMQKEYQTKENYNYQEYADFALIYLEKESTGLEHGYLGFRFFKDQKEFLNFVKKKNTAKNTANKTQEEDSQNNISVVTSKKQDMSNDEIKITVIGIPQKILKQNPNKPITMNNLAENLEKNKRKQIYFCQGTVYDAKKGFIQYKTISTNPGFSGGPIIYEESETDETDEKQKRENNKRENNKRENNKRKKKYYYIVGVHVHQDLIQNVNKGVLLTKERLLQLNIWIGKQTGELDLSQSNDWVNTLKQHYKQFKQITHLKIDSGPNDMETLLQEKDNFEGKLKDIEVLSFSFSGNFAKLVELVSEFPKLKSLNMVHSMPQKEPEFKVEQQLKNVEDMCYSSLFRNAQYFSKSLSCKNRKLGKLLFIMQCQFIGQIKNQEQKQSYLSFVSKQGLNMEDLKKELLPAKLQQKEGYRAIIREVFDLEVEEEKSKESVINDMVQRFNVAFKQIKKCNQDERDSWQSKQKQNKQQTIQSSKQQKETMGKEKKRQNYKLNFWQFLKENKIGQQIINFWYQSLTQNHLFLFNNFFGIGWAFIELALKYKQDMLQKNQVIQKMKSNFSYYKNQEHFFIDVFRLAREENRTFGNCEEKREKLKNITSLNLYGFKFSSVPQQLQLFANLQTFSLSKSCLTDIYREVNFLVKTFKNLKQISIEFNSEQKIGEDKIKFSQESLKCVQLETKNTEQEYLIGFISLNIEFKQLIEMVTRRKNDQTYLDKWIQIMKVQVNKQTKNFHDFNLSLHEASTTLNFQDYQPSEGEQDKQKIAQFIELCEELQHKALRLFKQSNTFKLKKYQNCKEYPQKHNNITKMKLDYNQFTFSYTFTNNFKNFCSLKQLDISVSYITELPELPNSLQILYCNQNWVTNLPDSITNLTQLKILQMRQNRVRKFPKNMENLKKSIKSLNFSKNRLSQISRIASLVVDKNIQIDLSQNYTITGQALTDLFKNMRREPNEQQKLECVKKLKITHLNKRKK